MAFDSLIPPDASSLLSWYDSHRRKLPWRALPSETPDPYRVWLSEIMLQQTTVSVVLRHYDAFLTRFATVEALAAAPVEAVMAAWAGLGYYARARNMHECAKRVAAAGGFPASLAGLRALPGIGDYTAAAIGAIAFGIPAIPMDGNVERIVARVFAIRQALPAAKGVLRALATRIGADPAARARPGDFPQAMFDLGATVCTPAAPACGVCPWMRTCRGRAEGIAAGLPIKAAKPDRPARFGAAFWLQDAEGRVLLRRRPPSGLLGGMLELPGTEWRNAPWGRDAALAEAPAVAAWRPAGQTRHGFTHFVLTLEVFAARLERIDAAGLLRPVLGLEEEALPSVMRKCAALAMGGRIGQ